MPHRPPKQVMIVLPLILLAIIGYWIYSSYIASIEANTASGFIEGEEIAIAAEVSGRIQAIVVEEGDWVKAGQELIRLDRTLLNAQIAQAQAAVETAQAQLAQVKAGARAEEIRQAEAALAQAIAARDGAKQAWENAKAARANPQELEARIAAAETQLKAAKFQWDAARANASAAKARVDAIGGVDQTRVEGKVIVEQWAAAEAALLSAQAGYEGAAKGLQILLEMRNNPLTLNTQVDAAKAQYEAASAAVEIAQARLDALKAGATQEQMAIAQAAVKQAEAALGILHVQSAKMTLTSPVNGIVSRRAARLGEIAAPNATLLSVTNLDTVKLTIYVPETRIGQIKLGDEFDVYVDSFPDKAFKGKVVFISTQAEFTPRNVQTKAERVNTVFAVKLQIANPNLELKPGMPADALLK